MVDDADVTAVLSDLARTLATDFPVQAILDRLVERIVDILPIDAAGVSLISPSAAPRFVAGSDESAVRYEHLQTALGEGPCLAAYATHTPIVISDLREDCRFPSFAVSALKQGLRAVVTFPLGDDDRCLGALDLYRRSPGSLGVRDMSAAQTLADVATAYLLNAEARSARSDFVAAVSHELRTPVASITGFVELLLDEDVGELTDEQQSFVGAIGRNSVRLAALLDGLLNLNQLESRSERHPLLLVDLRDAVLAAELTLQRQIATRRLEVSFTIPDTLVPVQGNLTDLESVVVNLMTNALKFTRDGGRVSCVLDAGGDTARVKVSDNGLGIPLPEQRDLFTRFFRSSTAVSHAIQGTGLGLTIVSSIVRRHGGTIVVDSAHLQGSRFTVELPLAEAMSGVSARAVGTQAPQID